MTAPWPWSVSQQLLDFSADATPPTGGKAQRLSRLGSRWSVTFTAMPGFDSVCGPAALALRTQARANAQPVTVSWPQPAFTAAIGAPTVSGGGQFGSFLNVTGLTPGAVIPALSFFSVAVGGNTYLYCTVAQVSGGSDTTATLTIAPMLRAPPALGAVVNFANPQIQGFVAGASESWTLDRLAWTGLAGFTVTEAA